MHCLYLQDIVCVPCPEGCCPHDRGCIIYICVCVCVFLALRVAVHMTEAVLCVCVYSLP